MSPIRILAAAFTVVLAKLIYRGHLSPLAKYPGPFLARYTNLWRFFKTLSSSTHEVDAQLAARYGPIVRVGPNSLFFSSPAGCHAVSTLDKVFEKGSFWDFARDPATDVDSLVTARTLADVRDSRRRVLHGAFSTASLASYKPIIAKNAAALVRRMQKALMPNQASDSINISPLVQLMATNTNFELIHGISMDNLPRESQMVMLDDIRAIARNSFAISYLPLLRYLLSLPFLRALFRKLVRTPNANSTNTKPQGFGALFFRSLNVVSNHRDTVAGPSAQPSFLKAWMNVPSEDKSKILDMKRMAWECLILILAGRGSTAAAITAILHKLGTREGKAWQRHIREELFDSSGARIVESMPPSLSAVTRETLRLQPPTPRSLVKEVGGTGKTILSGMTEPLPVGTEVWTSTYVVSRSPEVWGPDAAQWKPERWLNLLNEKKMIQYPRPEDGEYLNHLRQKSIHSLEGQFLAFGKGARSCIGRNITMMVIFEVVAQVLQMWDIQSDVEELKMSSDWEMVFEHCQLRLIERSWPAGHGTDG